jgi:hypothetical protein
LIKVLIVCYRMSGTVYRRARLVAEGVEDVPGAEPAIRTVQELIPEAIIDARDEVKAGKSMQQGILLVTLKDFLKDFRYAAREQRCAAPLPRQRLSRAPRDEEISRR